MSDRAPPGEAALPEGAAASAPQPQDQLIDPGELGKLRWRCRRGLLENDLFIERFFDRHAAALTARQAAALSRLMELDDTDLLALLLRRQELPAGMNTSEVRQVLEMLRTRGASPDDVH